MFTSRFLYRSIFIFLFLLITANRESAKVLSINEDLTLKFEKISVEHGLSQGTVNAVLQDQKGFLWFGTEDGLNKFDGYSFVIYKNILGDSTSISHNNISALFEDSLGTIWVGTNGGGLNKYNSRTNNFSRYKFIPNDPYCFECSVVNTIYEDKEGEIWVGTATAGIHKYDESKDGFIKYKSDSINNNLPTNRILSIYEDSYGTFWIGTDLGLYNLDKETGIFYEVLRHKELPDIVPFNQVNTIYEDQYGELWSSFGTSALNLYNRKKESFLSYLIDKDDPASFTYNDVTSITEDGFGNLWVGTDGGGLYIFDRYQESFIGYQNSPNTDNTLSANYIRCVYEDRNGIIWIGTWGGGVNKAVREKQHFDKYQRNPGLNNSLSHNRILSMHASSEGIIWIGTDGGGLNSFNVATEKFKHFKYSQRANNSIGNNYVSALFEDQQKNLWIGTFGGGLNKLNTVTGRFTRYPHSIDLQYSVSSPLVTTISKDDYNNLWVGTFGGGINIIEENQIHSDRPVIKKIYADTTNPRALTSNYILKIFKDKAGIMWIATEGGGLVSYNIETRLITPYVNNPNDSSTISSNNVSTIYEPENERDVLWIGTFDNGLCKLTKGYKDDPAQFDHYSIEQGLPSKKILSIIEDDDENLWIATDRGLSKLNLASETIYNFDVRDGLQNNEFSLNASCKSIDGEIFIGGVNGFNKFYPTKIKPIEEIPEVIITDLKLFNISVTPGDDSPLSVNISEAEKIKLDYDEDVFSLEFASLDLTDPRRNEYAYMLEGFNDDWVYTTWNNRIATYTNLPAGTYTFKVKASNSDGLWNEEGASIIVEVVPPFWQTWWFIGIVLMISGSLAFLMIKRRYRNVRMKIELQAAHDAQMSIMPQNDPQIDGFEVSGICLPASEVGGDFFDYIWLNKDQTKLGIVVGDVSGKAMRSAMTAVLTSGMINSQVQETTSIDEIMTKINYPIFQKTERQMFIALCFASIELKKYQLNFTNAGLLKPLIKSNGNVELLESEGLKFPLGAFPDTKYDKRTIELNDQDVIVIYSDGLTEAQNSSKQFYGNDRIKRALVNMDVSDLSAREIKDRLVEDIIAFTGNAPQHDDMTIVVIKVKNDKQETNTD